MPKDPEDLEKKTAPEEDGSITVDLNKDKKKEPTAQEVEREQFDKERKRVEYLSRQLEKGLKKIDDIAANFSRPAPAPAAPAPAKDAEREELDKMAETDWVPAVDRVAEKAAQRVLDAKDKKRELENIQRMHVERVEKSKAQVLIEYPDADDPETETGKLYLQAMNEMAKEDPNIYANVYGPVLVKARMESMMHEKGIVPAQFRKSVSNEVSQEMQRRERVGASSIPAGRQTGSENIVVLTAEEKSLCEENGIPLASYARMKTMGRGDFRTGVSVQ